MRGWPFSFAPSRRTRGRSGVRRPLSLLSVPSRRSSGPARAEMGVALLLRSVSPVPTAHEARRPATAAESQARRVWSCLRDILTALRRRATPIPALAPCLPGSAACHGRREPTRTVWSGLRTYSLHSEKGQRTPPALAFTNQWSGLPRPPRAKPEGYGAAFGTYSLRFGEGPTPPALAFANQGDQLAWT